MLIFVEYLLENISILRNSKCISLRSGNFGAQHTGLLTATLHHLPLPKEGYYFHFDAVANVLSMARVSDHHHIVMDTNVDNTIYLFNANGTYICFNQTDWNVYSMQIGQSTKTEQCLFTTVKGMEMQ